MKPKAILCGSFDPLTNGHVDLIQRASNLFDLTVLVAHHPNKHRCMCTQTRVKMIQEVFPECSVEAWSGAVADYAKEHEIGIMVRGIRDEKDLAFEKDLAYWNGQLGQMETVCLLTKPEYAHLSSSAIRELMALGKDISAYVPEVVWKGVKTCD